MPCFAWVSVSLRAFLCSSSEALPRSPAFASTSVSDAGPEGAPAPSYPAAGVAGAAEALPAALDDSACPAAGAVRSCGYGSHPASPGVPWGIPGAQAPCAWERRPPPALGTDWALLARATRHHARMEPEGCNVAWGEGSCPPHMRCHCTVLCRCRPPLCHYAGSCCRCMGPLPPGKLRTPQGRSAARICCPARRRTRAGGTSSCPASSQVTGYPSRHKSQFTGRKGPRPPVDTGSESDGFGCRRGGGRHRGLQSQGIRPNDSVCW